MNRIKSIFFKLRQQKKYSASNPANFEEIWSFNATGIQLISLIALVLLIVGLLVALLAVKGPFVSYFSKNDTSIERKKLEKQYREITKLTKELDAQEAYIESIKLIISGKIIEDSISTDTPNIQSINLGEIQSEQTENENELSVKVKADLRTNSRKKNSVLHYFVEPVKGVVSQEFDLYNHPAVDIVTEKDKNIVACLSGTIIYAGFTQKDGFVIVLDHSNGFLSVYKHAKTLLKKMGAKVQMNDPIGIVGNTGENSTGPHLHFELWYNQSVVNPSDYMKFEN